MTAASRRGGWRLPLLLGLVALVVLGGVAAGGRALALLTAPARPWEPVAPVRPGEETTGVPFGTVLRPSGAVEVTVPGMVIDRLDVHGPVDVRADGVVIRRSRVRGGDFWGIRIHDGVTGTRIEDTTIAPARPKRELDGIRAESGFVGLRLDISRTSDGVKAGSGTRLEASWIHDLTAGTDDHSDAVQILSGTGIALVGNALEGASNAAVMASTEFGPISGLVIEGNWLAGGNYTLNLRGGPYGPLTRLRVIGNRFERDARYGPVAIDGHVEQAGNVWVADGRPLAL